MVYIMEEANVYQITLWVLKSQDFPHLMTILNHVLLNIFLFYLEYPGMVRKYPKF